MVPRSLRWVTAALVVTLVLTLAACGEKDQAAASNDQSGACSVFTPQLASQAAGGASGLKRQPSEDSSSCLYSSTGDNNGTSTVQYVRVYLVRPDKSLPDEIAAQRRMRGTSGEEAGTATPVEGLGTGATLVTGNGWPPTVLWQNSHGVQLLSGVDESGVVAAAKAIFAAG